jgi:hypothetical protein
MKKQMQCIRLTEPTKLLCSAIKHPEPTRNDRFWSVLGTSNIELKYVCEWNKHYMYITPKSSVCTCGMWHFTSRIFGNDGSVWFHDGIPLGIVVKMRVTLTSSLQENC